MDLDLILNDFSLTGQYSSFWDFKNELKDNILPCLELSKDLQINFLLKSYNVCDLPVTKDETVRSVLKNRSSDTVIQKILLDYAKHFLKGPYWEDNPVTPKGINQTCKTEAFFRNGILLSFVPSEGNEALHINVKICNKDETVCNATNTNQFLECLSEKNRFSLDSNFKLDGSNCIFMIHTGQSEDVHKEQHFHIKTHDNSENTSVSLRTFDLLVDERDYAKQKALFRKDIKIASSEANKKRLVRIWNYFHPENPI